MENPAAGKKLADAIHLYYEKPDRKTIIGVLETIRASMHEGGEWMIPVIPPLQMFDMLNPETISVGDTFTVEEELHFRVNHIETGDGREWMAAFTSGEELEKGESTSTICQPVEDILKGSRNMREEGIMINPWGESFLLTKDLIRMILEADTPDNHICFEICDITKMKVDAIVNAANQTLLGGGGVDGAIHRAAGPGLLNECRKLGGCQVGQAKITGGWNLDCRYIIHTVGPHYQAGNRMCGQQLFNCYWNSLELAKKHDIHSIAFPAISTGAYGYPKQEAAAIALHSVSGWLSENPDYGMAVIMVCYDVATRECYQNCMDASGML